MFDVGIKYKKECTAQPKWLCETFWQLCVSVAIFRQTCVKVLCACLTGDFDASELTDGEQNQVCFLSVSLTQRPAYTILFKLDVCLKALNLNNIKRYSLKNIYVFCSHAYGFPSRTSLAVIHRIWRSYWINWHGKTNKSLSWKLNYGSVHVYFIIYIHLLNMTINTLKAQHSLPANVLLL